MLLQVQSFFLKLYNNIEISFRLLGNWDKYSKMFDKCGKNIKTFIAYIVQYCCNDVELLDEIPILLKN